MHIAVALSILISSIKLISETFVCENDEMFENSNDQHTFWHCSHGNAYLKYCPEGLI